MTVLTVLPLLAMSTVVWALKFHVTPIVRKLAHQFGQSLIMYLPLKDLISLDVRHQVHFCLSLVT